MWSWWSGHFDITNEAVLCLTDTALYWSGDHNIIHIHMIQNIVYHINPKAVQDLVDSLSVVANKRSFTEFTLRWPPCPAIQFFIHSYQQWWCSSLFICPSVFPSHHLQSSQHQESLAGPAFFTWRCSERSSAGVDYTENTGFRLVRLLWSKR